jgi:hypothetical protein
MDPKPLKPRKALFLDVDGVLNHAEMYDRLESGVLTLIPPHRMLDEKCCARVRRIAAETGCEVVLSSTWRLGGDGFRTVARALHPLRLSEKTPYDGTSCPRWKEISAWLTHARPRVTAYAILDDDGDAEIAGHFVQTSFEYGGLTDELADRAIAILGSVEP